MKSAVFLTLVIAACVAHRSHELGRHAQAPVFYAGASVGSGSGSASQPCTTAPAVASAVTPYVTRTFPPGTFDLLSGPIAAGQSITETITLPAGWAVTGSPAMAVDPMTGVLSPFVVDSASTTAGIYTVVAHNVGSASAQLVADVPYSGVGP